MKLSLSFFVAAVALGSASVSSARRLRGNDSLDLDMEKVMQDRRVLQDGDSGGCYDMGVHQCSCEADRCSKDKCDGVGGIWTGECPSHCTDCGGDEGTLFMSDESGSITANEDGVVLSSSEGSIIIGTDSITFTDENGDVVDMEGAIEYDDATGMYSITNEDGETLAFDEN
jgi:hypothetical protein